MREDIKCHVCAQNEALNLLYYRKTTHSMALPVITHPTLICDDCLTQFLESNRLIKEGRPQVLYPVNIALMDFALLMWLTTDKGKAHNDLDTTLWRKKLKRLKKICDGRYKKYIYQSPMSIN